MDRSDYRRDRGFILSDQGLRRISTFLILLFVTVQMYSQPGGGGGLLILNLYNDKQELIHIPEDTSLKIRTFILSENKIYEETFLQQSYLAEKGKLKIGWNYGFGLPPASEFVNHEDPENSDESDQRMVIIYKNDTMIIDFIGVIGENGIGFTDGMDSLVIQKGCFRYYRFEKYGKSYIYEDFDKNKNLIHDGLTPYTVKLLSKEGYIEYKSKIDISFLLEDNLPESYFLKRAGYYLNNNQTNAALSDIYKGISKNHDKKNCESLFLLTDTYSKTGQYDQAITFISEAINCIRYRWENNNLNNYRTRALLYIKTKKFDLALKDYDTIVIKAAYKIDAHNERALFLISTLKDYESAIHDLTEIIHSIPDSDLNGCNPQMTKYAETYFNLGLAEYYSGQEKRAFRHWLKAVQWAYKSGGSKEVIVHLDSIIRHHPKVPELYLARAIANQGNIQYLGVEDAQECLNNTLKDINEAEKLGLKDFWINIYRAISYQLLKNNQKALEEISIAIKKQSKYPGAYLMRYNIREATGQTIWGNQNDPDIIEFKKCCNNWEYKK